MKPTRIFLAACALLALGSAHAVTLTWNTNTSGGPADGGGTWDTATAHWWNGTGDVAWNNAGGDTARFGAASGAASTVTITGVTASGLIFSPPGSGNYTLSGGTITLGSGGIDASALTGGTTTLGSGVTLSGGVQPWSIGSGATLAINGPVTLNGGAAMNFVPAAGGLFTTTSLANTNDILGPAYTFGTGTAMQYASVSGGGITGYTGATSLGNNNAAPGAGSATTNYQFTGYCRMQSGNFSANTINSTGANTNLNLWGNTLTLGGFLASGTGYIYFNTGAGGKLTTPGGTGDLVFAGSQIIYLCDYPDFPGNIANQQAIPITGANTRLVYNGTSQLVMGAATNTYGGGTIVNGGTLALGVDGNNNQSAGALGTGPVLIGGGGALRFGGVGAAIFRTYDIPNDITVDNGSITQYDGVQNLNGALTIGAGGAAIYTQWNNKGIVVAGVLGGSGPLALGNLGGNASHVTFSAANSYSGVVSFNGNTTVHVNHTDAFAQATVNLTGATGSAVAFGQATAAFGGLTGAGDLLLPGSTLTVGGNNATTTYSGVLGGTDAGLTKTGTGTLTLTGINTYTGETNVAGGTLAVNGTSIPDAGKLVLGGGKLHIAAAANETVNTLYYGAVAKPAGTYGSSASAATFKDDTHFSGTGILTVTTGPGSFESYMAGYPSLSGAAVLRTADPDGDGLTNLMEFAFGMNPADQTLGAITWSGSVVTGHGTPATKATSVPNGLEFTAVFGRRNDYIAAGLTYTVQFSANLVDWADSTDTPTVIASDTTIDAVGVHFPSAVQTGSGTEKPRFFRVKVSG